MMLLLRLLRLLTSDGEPPHRAAAPGRAGAGGGRAGLPRWRSQARRSRGEDHGDGFALAAAQREANGLLGGLLGPQASAAVDGHQGADDDEGHEDTSHHEERDINGLWEEQTHTD